jgi:sec-independent protein translocase protein TatC
MKSDAVIPEDKKMPLLDHIVELRNRLLWCVAALMIVFLATFLLIAQDIFNFLVQPLADILLERNPNARMFFGDITEFFFTQVKVSFFFSAFVCTPVILTQIWRFVAPGLYRNERQALRPFLFATPILFATGAAMVYYILMPMAWEFFLSYEQVGQPAEGTLNIVLDPKVGDYLSLVMLLVFAFGLSFQLPVVLTLLARVGIASAAGLARSRRYAIVLVFVFAAIFTPPDPVSQLALAIPIILLYEVSIQLAKITERKRREREAEAERDAEAEETSSA